MTTSTCSRCGGTMLDYDDWSVCEFVGDEQEVFEGRVECSFDERGDGLEFGRRPGVGLLAPEPFEYRSPSKPLLAEAPDLADTNWQHLVKHHEVATRHGDQAAPKGEWSDEYESRYEHLTGHTITPLLAEPVERSREWAYGFAGVYRDAEQAASMVVYFDDEPVTPEQPAIDEWNYPGEWDRGADLILQNGDRYDSPRLKDGQRASIRRELAAWS